MLSQDEHASLKVWIKKLSQKAAGEMVDILGVYEVSSTKGKCWYPAKGLTGYETIKPFDIKDGGRGLSVKIWGECQLLWPSGKGVKMY